MRPLITLAALLTLAPAAAAHEFRAPDAGPLKTPYACSFHWFVARPAAAGEARVVGLDVVRSDDLGRLGLRVFVFDGRRLRALVHEAPAAAWAPFATAAPPDLDGARDALGRGPGWIAAAVRGAGPDLRRVRLHLRVTPRSAPRPVGDLGTGIAVRLSAVDWLRARTTGWVEVDGERLEVDADGPLSLHVGTSLPDYGYLATLPGAPGPGLLLASVGRDDLRVGGDLLGERAVTYAHWTGLPGHLGGKRTLSVEAIRGGRVAFPGTGREVAVERVVAQVPHTLLGRPTTTFVAEVTLRAPRSMAPWDLRRPREHRVLVIGDARGQAFVDALAPARGLAQALGQGGR
ncbi:MAG: hypothetical protein M9894_17950 [Planctomycetes bacterium]|nr:hypothetical protein [Planctomycetota bacterium]